MRNCGITAQTTGVANENNAAAVVKVVAVDNFGRRKDAVVGDVGLAAGAAVRDVVPAE